MQIIKISQDGKKGNRMLIRAPLSGILERTDRYTGLQTVSWKNRVGHDIFDNMWPVGAHCPPGTGIGGEKRPPPLAGSGKDAGRLYGFMSRISWLAPSPIPDVNPIEWIFPYSLIDVCGALVLFAVCLLKTSHECFVQIIMNLDLLKICKFPIQ